LSPTIQRQLVSPQNPKEVPQMLPMQPHRQLLLFVEKVNSIYSRAGGLTFQEMTSQYLPNDSPNPLEPPPT